MNNFIGIFILIFIEAVMIATIIAYYNYKLNVKDNEIMERDKLLTERTIELKKKNLKIKELQDDNKRKINKGL